MVQLDMSLQIVHGGKYLVTLITQILVAFVLQLHMSSNSKIHKENIKSNIPTYYTELIQNIYIYIFCKLTL